MEGKELLALLDLVKDFRTDAEKLGKEAEEAIEEKPKLKLKAEVYIDAAERLDRLLRRLNT